MLNTISTVWSFFQGLAGIGRQENCSHKSEVEKKQYGGLQTESTHISASRTDRMGISTAKLR